MAIFCLLFSGCSNGSLSSTGKVTPSFSKAHSYNGTTAYDNFTSSFPNISVPISVEFFFKANVLAGNQYLFAINPVNAFYLYLGSTGTLNIAGPGGGCGSITNSTASVIMAGTVYHLAYVISSSGIGTIFLNGTPIAPTISGLAACASTAFTIGSAPGGVLPFNGIIEEFRISNNDRSTGGGTSYPIPSAPLTQDANTVILMHMDVLNFVDYTNIGTGVTSNFVTLVSSFFP